jgi:hypothetical protein
MVASVDIPPRVRQFASELAQPQPMRRGSVSERAITRPVQPFETFDGYNQDD